MDCVVVTVFHIVTALGVVVTIFQTVTDLGVVVTVFHIVTALSVVVKEGRDILLNNAHSMLYWYQT